MRSLKLGLMVAVGTISGLLWADPVVQNIGGPFAGLNNQDNPLIIPPSQAQDLLNVDITPGGRSVKRRKGYGLDATLNISTGPVHGGYHFYDASGNDIRLWANDVNVSGSVNNAAYTVLVTSMSVGSTLQCADSQGLAYCVDSSRDFLLRTNGASILWRTDILGKTITASADRLVVADLSGDQNSLHFSAQGDFTNFVAGSQVASPFTESILAPGSHITHTRYAFGRYLWWKDQSFGYVVGTDQTNVQVVIVSYLVGTQDNSSVENEGIVYFRGNDNHIWAYDGANLTRMSREITPTVTSANVRRLASWKQSSSSDFNSGSFSSTTYNSTQGGVVLITNTPPDNSFESVSGLTNLVWTVYGLSTSFNNVQAANFNVDCTINAKDGRYLEDYFTTLAQPTVMNVRVIDATTSVFIASTTVTWSDNNCTWTQQTITGLSGAANKYAEIQIQDATNTNQYLLSSSFTLNGNNITFWFASTLQNVLNENIFAFDLFNVPVTTGTYYSAVKNDPNLSSWDIFSAVAQNNGGSHSYFVRSSTNSFTVTSTTPTWIAQTNNATVAASTGTYFQMSDTFTVTQSTNNPILQNFTFNWFDGTASDKSYMTYFDFGLWFSISTGTVTTNNLIVRYDLINGAWTLYSIPINGFLVQNNSLYFGDSTTGKVYKFGTNDNDNGTAINAYWKSKDFSNVGTGGATGILGYNPNDSPFIKKDYRMLNTFIASQATGNLSVTYSLDRGAGTTYSFAMNDPNGLSTTHSNYYLPFGTKGYAINVQYGNNVVDQPWELFGGQLTYEPGKWQPYP